MTMPEQFQRPLRPAYLPFGALSGRPAHVLFGQNRNGFWQGTRARLLQRFPPPATSLVRSG